MIAETTAEAPRAATTTKRHERQRLHDAALALAFVVGAGALALIERL